MKKNLKQLRVLSIGTIVIVLIYAAMTGEWLGAWIDQPL